MLLIEWCVQNREDCYGIEAAVFRVEVKTIFNTKKKNIGANKI
jgi:hypothetical protein